MSPNICPSGKRPIGHLLIGKVSPNSSPGHVFVRGRVWGRRRIVYGRNILPSTYVRYFRVAYVDRVLKYKAIFARSVKS